MTELQSPPMVSSHCCEEDIYSFTYSFVNSVGRFSPICQGLLVQDLCWVLGHRAGQDRQRSG